MSDFVPVHHQFLALAQADPDRCAVSFGGRTTTYGDLASRVAAVAARLADLESEVGSVVPIATTDPVEAIEGILGCWWLGLVPSPLDPKAPPERLVHQLYAISPEWLVLGAVPPELDRYLTERYSMPGRVRFDEISTGIGPLAPPLYDTAPDDPAYLFLTSGSTGPPKGIIGRHSGIDHFLNWERDITGAGEGTKVSMLTSIAFDAVLRDIFLPLTSGGTVCIPTAETRADPGALVKWLSDEQVNVLHCVPSVFSTLVTAATTLRPSLEALETVLLAGEVLRPDVVAQWHKLHGTGTRLINSYGPSETTMTKTFHLVDEADAKRRSIPVGRPMPGVRLALLNETMQPVADGVVGEIFIRTPFMSLGYFNNPDETRKRFIPNPLSDDPEDFVYRTGDFGRIDPNGELDFLGRRDRQVKSAGIRIELEEVETAVLSIPGVRQVAVRQIEADEGDPFLCAYVVASETVDTADARARLEDWLPAGAIPTLFIPMGELPRTISGKVDHGALPEPVLIVDGECIEPGNSTEELVLDLWRQLLPATTNLGVTNNFFAVGGHSLLVMRLIALIEDELGVALNLRDLLERPTVERIASLIEEAFVADLSSDEALLRELLDVSDDVPQVGG